jgi:hypothetical protein
MRKNLNDIQEVAHYWANKVQIEGKAGNVFFYNETIYSYGRHFPIAKHYNNGLILFTTRSYSVTTSGHVSMVRSAITYGANILYCHSPENPQSKDNYDSAIRDIEYNLKKAIKARQRKREYLRYAEHTYNQLRELIKTFKIKGWKVPKYDFSIPENVLVVMKEKERKADAKRKRQEAKQRKQDKLDMVEFLMDVKRWKTGEIKSAYSVKHSRFINEADFCRINEDRVESMRSADIPLKEAILALKRIKTGKSIKGLQLGHYTVINYDKEALTIGCHKFLQSEIDYLMKELDI